MTVRWLQGVVLTVLMSSTVLADPSALDLDGPPHVNGNGGEVPSPALSDDVDALPDLHEHVQLRLPTFRSLDDPFGDPLVPQMTMYRPIPGSHVTRYRGLQGFVLKRLRRRFRKEWRKQFKAMEEFTNISAFELRDRYERMYQQIGDHRMGGQYWNRTWWQSLPESRGGAPATPYVEIVGKRLRILEIGPLSLTNEFRARIDKVGVISLDPDSGRVFRAHEDHHRLTRFARLTRSDDTGLATEEEVETPEERQGAQRAGAKATERLAPLDSVDLLFDIDEATGWFEGMRWRFRARPGMRVRVRDIDEIQSSFRLRGVFDLEVGKARKKALRVETTVRYRLQDNELRASLQIELLSW